MKPKYHLLAFLTCGIVLTSNLNVFAIEAKSFPIEITNQPAINLRTEHYTVDLVYGRIAHKDGLFRTLFSTAAKLVISISSDVKASSTESFVYAGLFEDQSVSHDVDHPFGENPRIVDNVPAIYDANVTIRITTSNNDTIDQVFQSLDRSKASLPASIFASQYFGYAKAADDLIRSLFGTDKNTIPFYWSGSIKNVIDASSSSMKPHYIVLLAKQSNQDSAFDSLEQDKFTFTDGTLKYDGSTDAIKNRSYCVLRVQQGEGYNIDYESRRPLNEPWIPVAKSFIEESTLDINTKDKLVGFAKERAAQLKTLDDLLTREKRFSPYDIAVALKSYSDIALGIVNGRCSQLHLSGWNCPNSDLLLISSTVGPQHNIPASLTNTFLMDINRFTLRVRDSLRQ